MDNSHDTNESRRDIDGQSPEQAARTLWRLPPDDIQTLLAQLPHTDALAIAAQLPNAKTAQANEAITDAAAADIDARIDELLTPAPAVLGSAYTVAEAVAFLVNSDAVAQITYIFVVGLFEDTITQIVALAAFLPVLAGQSGNTGCQALAITLFTDILGMGLMLFLASMILL